MDMRRDSRQNSSGKPLRNAFDASFLMKSSSGSDAEDKRAYVYESQMSFMVTGYNKSIWAAYGLVDTYHHAVGDLRDKDSIQHYVDDFNEGDGVNWDPLSAGTHDAECPVWDPREYFLLLLNARAQQVAEEWLKLVSILRQNIEDYVRRLLALFTLSFHCPTQVAGVCPVLCFSSSHLTESKHQPTNVDFSKINTDTYSDNTSRPSHLSDGITSRDCQEALQVNPGDIRMGEGRQSPPDASYRYAILHGGRMGELQQQAS